MRFFEILCRPGDVLITEAQPAGVRQSWRGQILLPLRTNCSLKLLNCIYRVKANGLCKLKKLNNIDPALATLNGSDK